METFKISIPKPCHENWDRMTPNERGRFCDSCCKTVVDFSGKSAQEIWRIIKQHTNEKICGRFRNDQLNKPIRIELYWEPFRNRLDFHQAFLLSLLIVFSSTLFSCTTHDGKTIGEISLVDSVVTAATDSVETINADEKGIENIVENNIENNIDINHEDLQIEKSQSINQFESILDDTIKLREVDIIAFPLLARDYLTGLIQVNISKGEEDQPIVKSVSNVKEKDEKVIGQLRDNSIIFPNPANDIVNLRINVTVEKFVKVELFDLNGKLIRTLLEKQVVPIGENDIQFDVSDLVPATYILRIMKGDEMESKRVVVI